MFESLTQLKQQLSTLRRNAWHAKLLKFSLGRYGNLFSKKACVYWWVGLPTSMVVSGIVVILALALMAIMAICFPIAAGLGWFLGFKPRYWFLWDGLRDEENLASMFIGPYKMKWDQESDDYIMLRFAPYQLVLPLVALVTAIVTVGWWASYLDKLAWVGGGIVAGLTVLALIGFTFKRVMIPLYQKWCPEITWVDDEPTVQTAGMQ